MVAPESHSKSQSTWQFGLLAMFALTTSVAVVCGAARLHLDFGPIVTVPLVGSFWAYATWRQDRRQLAYYLTAASSGAAALAVLLLVDFAIGTVAKNAIFGGVSQSLQSPFLCLLIPATTFASTAAAFTLRAKIRIPGHCLRRWFHGVSAEYCYITGIGVALLLPIIFLAVEAIAGDSIFSFSTSSSFVESAKVFIGRLYVMFLAYVFVAALLTVGSLVFVSLSLPLTWPVAMLIVHLLRRIDPLERELTEQQWRIVLAITDMEARGVAQIDAAAIAEHLGISPNAIKTDMKRLRDKRIFRMLPHLGCCIYRCPRSVPPPKSH